MVKINSIICTYWPERVPNLGHIINSLQQGSVPPDNIFILNNNRNVNISMDGAYAINSQYNFMCRGKFASAMLDAADYYLFLDDDTAVGYRTIEKNMQYADKDSCFGYLGMILPENNLFSGSTRVAPQDVNEITRCDTFCGCGMFMSFKSVVNMLELESKVRIGYLNEWPHQGDDIVAGLANISNVIPMHDDERYVDLGWNGVAMGWGDPVAIGFQGRTYDQMRDEFTVHIKQIMDSEQK